MASSCTEPADPTPTKMAYGDWAVQEVYVNGQANPPNNTVISRFTLERDDSYVLVDNNGFISVGTWTATETNLTLSEADTTSGGMVYDFSIIFQSYEKMHLVQTISNPTAGDIQIRYLMDRESDGEQYN